MRGNLGRLCLSGWQVQRASREWQALCLRTSREQDEIDLIYQTNVLPASCVLAQVQLTCSQGAFAGPEARVCMRRTGQGHRATQRKALSENESA